MNLPTAAKSYRTTDTRKEWEEPGEMTIRKTSKPCIGGATPKRVRAELATDDRSVHSCSEPCQTRAGGREVCKMLAAQWISDRRVNFQNAANYLEDYAANAAARMVTAVALMKH